MTPEEEKKFRDLIVLAHQAGKKETSGLVGDIKAQLDALEENIKDNYSKRELDEHFKDLGAKIDSNTDITKSLDTKVGVQNGRVGKLETKFGGVSMAGACAIFLIGIIMSLVVYSFQLSQQKLKSEILLELRNIIE